MAVCVAGVGQRRALLLSVKYQNVYLLKRRIKLDTRLRLLILVDGVAAAGTVIKAGVAAAGTVIKAGVAAAGRAVKAGVAGVAVTL